MSKDYSQITPDDIREADRRLRRRDGLRAIHGLRDLRWYATALLYGGVLSYLITLTLGVQSAIGSMLFGVLPGAAVHAYALVRERRLEQQS